MYYHWKLGVWPWSFKFKQNKVLSFLLLKYLNKGITKVSGQGRIIHISFKGGMEFYAWNHDKFAGWLQHGALYNKYGLLLDWSQTRPSARVMYELDKAIKAYEDLH